jgi:cytoskeletal protein CcmA (bactofilin family)
MIGFATVWPPRTKSQEEKRRISHAALVGVDLRTNSMVKCSHLSLKKERPMIQWLKNKIFPSRILHSIGPNGAYTGEIVFDEVFVVAGTFCGSLRVNDENKTRLTHLVIEKGGRVITTDRRENAMPIDEVEIYGSFEGDIRCRHLFIAKTAKVSFTHPFEVETLTLEPGAQFTGSVTVTGNKAKKETLFNRINILGTRSSQA